jgi:mannose-1-phosphate guanylyltransferase
MTKIEDGATIVGPSMIGRNCHICAGARIDNSVVFEYSRIGDDVCLTDKLVFGRYCVDKTGNTIDLQAAALDWLITDSRQPVSKIGKTSPLEARAIVQMFNFNGQSRSA